MKRVEITKGEWEELLVLLRTRFSDDLYGHVTGICEPPQEQWFVREETHRPPNSHKDPMVLCVVRHYEFPPDDFEGVWASEDKPELWKYYKCGDWDWSFLGGR